jgi:receptor expression-enhancing protein 5/6
MDQMNQYIESLSVHFDDIPWIKTTADRFNLKSAHIALAIIGVAFALVLSGILDDLTCNLIGILYPAYLSFKAIETQESDDDKQWLTYWVVFAIYNIIDDFSSILFFWLPFYYPIKLIVLLWMVWPKTRGAQVLYEVVIKRILKMYEAQIDEKLSAVDATVDKAAATAAELKSKATDLAGKAASSAVLQGLKRE